MSLTPDQEEVFSWSPATSAQQLALDCEADILFFGGSAGSLKALDLETPLPTPAGWTTMGEVQVGDELFDERGAVCRVIGLSPIYTDKKVYDVEFDDGTIIKACGDHRWLTMTDSERTIALRRDPEWRARRRANRPSRGKGKKPWLAERNAREAEEKRGTLQPPPAGQVRTTDEIRASLLYRGFRRNHSVPVAEALQLPDIELPIPPYVLGCHLGDGRTDGTGFTSADPEIIEEIERQGYIVRKRPSEPIGYGILGLLRQLRPLGLVGKKFIPDIYLRAGTEQRLALLQGLLDTDGSAQDKGSIFYSTNETLAYQFRELALSLGIRANVSSWEAKLNGKSCGTAYGVSFISTRDVFRLPRKLARQGRAERPTTRRRYIVDVRETESVPMRCITVDSPSHLYLCSRSFIPTHNTETMLMSAVQERDNPNLRAIIFRQNLTQLSDIIDKTYRLYKPLGGEYTDQPKWRWTFPSGATVRFGYLEQDKDVWKYLGPRYSFIGFDESTMFSEFQVRNMLGRLSSTDQRLKLRAFLASNPGGRGGGWHKNLFLRGRCPVHEPDLCAKPGVSYRDSMWPSDARPIPFNVAFIPGKLSDHKLLDADYSKRLHMMSGQHSAAMESGCWCELEGSYFSCWNKNLHAVPYGSVGEEWWFSHFLSLDYGFGKSSASAHMHVRMPPTEGCPDGKIVTVGELVMAQAPVHEFAKAVGDSLLAPTLGGHRRNVVAAFADPANFNANYDSRIMTGGRSVAEQMQDVLSDYEITLRPASNDRIAGWQELYRQLSKEGWAIADTCPKAIESIPAAVHDDKRPGDVLKVPGDPLDDVRDDLRYGLFSYIQASDKPRELRVQEAIASQKDITNAMMMRLKVEADIEREEAPVYLAGKALARDLYAGRRSYLAED